MIYLYFDLYYFGISRCHSLIKHKKTKKYSLKVTAFEQFKNSDKAHVSFSIQPFWQVSSFFLFFAIDEDAIQFSVFDCVCMVMMVVKCSQVMGKRKN